MISSTSIVNMHLKDIASKLLFANLLFCLLVEYFVRDIGLPSEIRYLTDILLLVVFALILLDRSSVSFRRRDAFRASTGLAVLLFVTWATLSSMLNLVSPLLYFWALRNTGRFLLLLYCCALVFSFEDWKKIMSFMSVFVVANTAFMAYEYYALGIRQDYLNGFLGTYVGGNSALNTVFVVVASWLVSSYLSKRIKFSAMAVPIAAMLIASALNELKFFYVELVLILVICGIALPDVRKDVVKGAGVILCALVSFAVGVMLLVEFYPGFQNFFTIESLQNYLFARSYNSSEQLVVNGIPVMNRMSSLVIIPEYFFSGLHSYLLGLGFGATETSSLSLFTSEFYRLYGETNYLGYSSANILLEVGYVGLLLYFGIFVSVMVFCAKRSTRNACGLGKTVYVFGIAIAILGLLMCFYNSALRIETSGFLYFTALAVPFMFQEGESVADSSSAA